MLGSAANAGCLGGSWVLSVHVWERDNWNGAEVSKELKKSHQSFS